MKLELLITAAGFIVSLPTRERGLKQQEAGGVFSRRAVAPHAGAWIETTRTGQGRPREPKSLPTRERGLKQPSGAITKTSLPSLPTRERGLKRWMVSLRLRTRPRSLPTRERGLKHDGHNVPEVAPVVAPHAGAWIETLDGEPPPANPP